MSILKVDAIRHNSATSDAITMASDGTCTARITGTTGGGGLSHRNILMNGSCAVSQRGTSFSGTGFTLDRYYVGSGDYSVAQVTDAPSNSGLTYSLRVSRTASTTGYLTFQMIELPATGQAGQFYNGAKFTLSGYVKGTSGATIRPTLRFSTGTGGSNGSSFTRTEGAFTCNGSWQPFTFHFTVDENVGGSDKCVQSYFTFVTTATGQNVFFTGLQLEAGDTATTFEHKRYADELLRCQRYYEEQYFMDDAGGTYIRGPVYWKVEKRSAGSPRVHAKRPDGTGSDTVDKIYQTSGERDAQCFYSWTGGTMVFNTGTFAANTDTLGRVSIDVEL